MIKERNQNAGKRQTVLTDLTEIEKRLGVLHWISRGRGQGDIDEECFDLQQLVKKVKRKLKKLH